MSGAAGRHASPYKTYTLSNLDQIPQLATLPREVREDIRIVGSVLPFKVNNYVVDELIDWDDALDDPIFHLTFPQREMLLPEHHAAAAVVAEEGVDPARRRAVIDGIRSLLNPHPAGQMDKNVPEIDGERLWGVQHKYRETVLFFPSAGQTCHAYCTFCFRWPQFIGMSEFKFASRETESLVRYLRQHPEATDLLFTGGDPLIMSAAVLSRYVEPFLEPDNGTNIQTIRLGTKALGYWPYRFLTDPDADDLLRLFERVTGLGLNLAVMAHFSHPRELGTPAVREAIARIRSTGAQIRTQSPLLRHINDSSDTWARMWREQVNLNCTPYYMFVARNTGAQHYFAVPLVEAWDIWRGAYRQVSGVCRTVRGPSMSCNPGKVQMLGVAEVDGRPVMTLRFLQGRDPQWVGRPFFARYDPDAIWMNELRPAFGERFFFETGDPGEASAAEDEEYARYE
jgi:L-lysine 2,3-aminomutase